MHRWRIGCVLLAAVLAGGCATNPPAAGDPGDASTYDPAEPANRASFDLNKALDQTFMAPMSEFYVMVTPAPIRDNVFNFFDNLSYPNVALNALLQGKFAQAFDDAARFLVNSTLGILGIVDIASGFGFERHDEDFGQTLAVWGVTEGAYLDLPLFGPSSMRDVTDIPVSIYTNPLQYAQFAAWPLALLNMIDRRSRLGQAIKLRDEAAVDPYVFQREAYRQRRRHLVYDGNPPLEVFELDDTSGDR